MIAIGRKLLADQRRRAVQVLEDTFYKSEWMESGQDPGLSPTVYLAEQPPGFVLPTHFHRQNQFQLFVEGTGSLGPHRLAPVTIHYAGAYTGYGPLIAGEHGIKYFTIRAIFDDGRTFASEARGRIVRGPRRHAAAIIGEPWESTRLGALERIEQSSPIPEEGGLAAQHVRLPPNAAFPLNGIRQSFGQFVFVLSGNARLGEAELAVWESVFLSADQKEASLAAGPQGVEFVCLHMPLTAPEYSPQRRDPVR